MYIIDATQIAVKAGLGKRINMIMQSVFFKLSGVMPFEEAIEMLKKSIKKMYGKKGDKVVQMNIDGVDASVSGIIECAVPEDWAMAPVSGEARSLLKAFKGLFKRVYEEFMRNKEVTTSTEIAKGPRKVIDVDAKQFAEKVQQPCNNLDGNALPVSAFVPGGRVPLGTSQYEKRGIAINVPKVDMDLCTQCNKCSLICPHAAAAWLSLRASFCFKLSR